MAMASKEKRTLLSIIFNGLIVFLVIFYLIFSFLGIWTSSMGKADVTIFMYYTTLSNLFAAIAGAILIPFQIISLKKKEDVLPLWAILLKYCAVIALLLTFLISAFWLGPVEVMKGGSYWLMFEGVTSIVHFFVPMLAFFSFSFFETNKKITFPYSFLGLSSMGLYAIFYISNYYGHFLSTKDGIYDWYSFFQSDSPFFIILIILGIFLFAYLLSFLTYFLNKKMREHQEKEES